MSNPDDTLESIRAEETVREEARQRVRDARKHFGLISFLNSPFGIYLLSTVLVGVVSFGYARWREAQDHALLTGAERQKVREEIRFRVQRMTDTLARVVADSHRWQTTDARLTATEEQRELQAYRLRVQYLVATIRLGGIAEPPGPIEPNGQSRFEEFVIEHNLLPLRVGSKHKEYEQYSLVELLSREHYLATGESQVPPHAKSVSQHVLNLYIPAHQLLKKIVWRGSLHGGEGGEEEVITTLRHATETFAPERQVIVNEWHAIIVNPAIGEIIGTPAA